MHYKTIALELLRQNTALHEELRKAGTLLRAMETHAAWLKERHEEEMESLRTTRPGSDPRQIASEAMEIAVAELEARLLYGSNATAEGPSLEGAMAYLARHTPTA